MDVFSYMIKEVVCRIDGKLPFFVSGTGVLFKAERDAGAFHAGGHILMWEWMINGNDCYEIWRNFSGNA